jgi:protein-L-isoaspartate(D-aspartate) O-methyltransferase
MSNFAQTRINMVDSQLRPNGITDGRILSAMQSVPREAFVGEAEQAVAYMDGDVVLKAAQDGARYLIEPMAFARMVQEGQVAETDKVLLIGAGTGYGAAVLSQLAAQVVAVEQDAGLAAVAKDKLSGHANVSVVQGALAQGAANQGKFDVVVIEGRVEQVPAGLFAQVKDGGRIVAAVGARDMAKCCVFVISGANHTMRRAFDISVAALPGFAAPKPAFAF